MGLAATNGGRNYDSHLVPVKYNATHFDWYVTSPVGSRWALPQGLVKIRGPVDNPAQTVIYSEADNRKRIHDTPSGPDGTGQVWIQNIIKRENGHLLGIGHYESNATRGEKKKNFRLSTIYSTDGGSNWSFHAHFLRAKDLHQNVGGGAMAFKDGYYYLYYTECQNTRPKRFGVVRCSESDLWAAADLASAPPFKKHYKGGWTEPGMGGDYTNLPFWDLGLKSCHQAAAYNTYVDKFMYTAGAGGKLLIAFSDDGVTGWTVKAALDLPNKGGKFWYSCIAPEPGEEVNGTVGRTFYVYTDDHGKSDQWITKVTLNINK